MATVTNNAGSNSSTASSATLVISGVNAAVGDWLVLMLAADNGGTNGASSTSNTVTDSAGNTWTVRRVATNDPGLVNEGTTLGMWTCQVTNALVAGSITMNFSPNTAAKAALVTKIQPGVGETVAFSAGSAQTTGTGTAHSITTSSLAAGTILVAVTAKEGRTFATTDSDTSNGSWSTPVEIAADTGVDLTSQVLNSQSKIVTGAGTQSYNTTSSSAADYAINWLSFTVTAGGGAAAVPVLTDHNMKQMAA